MLKTNIIPLSRVSVTAISVVIAILAVFLYIGTLGHGFVWDDQIVITQNTYTTQGLQGLADIWTNAVYILERSTYRPVAQTLYALEWSLFEDNPKAYHLIQLLLYGFCCFSFLWGLQLFFKSINKWVLSFICLLFALAPVHSEVVSNIKSGDELLSAIFVIWSFILTRQKTWFYTILALLFFILALLSKISAITVLPLFLFLLLRQNESLVRIKSFLIKHLDYLEFLTLVLFIAVLYFTPFSFLIPLLIILFILRLDINSANFFQFLSALVLIVMLRYYAWSAIALFISLFWYFKLENKSLSKNNIPLLFIALFAILGSIHSIGSLGYMIFLAFLVYNSTSKSKLPWFTWVLPIAYFIFFTVKIVSTPDFLRAEIIHGIVRLLLFSTPIILFSLNFSNKKITQLAALCILLFSIYISANYNYLLKLGARSMTRVEVDSNTLIEEDFALAPYHNILVNSNSSTEKIATISRIQLIYLQKLVFPTALVHQHGTWQLKLASWKDWDVYLSILIHVLLLWIAYYFYKQKYYIAMWGIIWYFMTISIYTNVFRLMPDTLAERFLFLPSIGFSIAFVSGLFFLIQKILKNERKAMLTLGIILFPLFCYYGFKTIDRNKDWENNYTLAANTLPYAKNNAAINAQYALELNRLIKAGQVENLDSAESLVVKHYQKSIDIFPSFYGPLADLASHYILKGEPDSAFPFLLKASELDPKEWLHHYYLGLIYYERKKYAEAINHFDELIANKTLQERPTEFPELLEAYEFAARCSHNIGKDLEAYAYLQEGIQVFNQKSTYILLANLYRKTGKTDLAIETFERLLELYPNDQEISNTIDYLKKGLIY